MQPGGHARHTDFVVTLARANAGARGFYLLSCPGVFQVRETEQPFAKTKPGLLIGNGARGALSANEPRVRHGRMISSRDPPCGI